MAHRNAAARVVKGRWPQNFAEICEELVSNARPHYIERMQILIFLFGAAWFENVNAADSLKLSMAQSIAGKAAACGAKNHWKLSVAIVNAEGNLVYFHRDDDAYLGSIDASIDKAKSANAFRRPTRVFAESMKDGRPGLATVKNVVGIEGGVPIALEGKHAGAIGVSGAKSTEDELCAVEALKSWTN
jgi:glc operon protein GlcG